MTKDELFSHIKKTICEGEGISKDIVFMKTRKKEIVFTRQLIMYFAYAYNVGSQSEVGSLCGKKDHSTVVHANKVINNYLDTDPKTRDLINDYKLVLKGLKPPTVIPTKDQVIADLNSKNEGLKGEIKELSGKVKLLEDEIFRLQCRLNNHRVKQGESVQPYHGYVAHF